MTEGGDRRILRVVWFLVSEMFLDIRHNRMIEMLSVSGWFTKLFLDLSSNTLP